MYENELTQAFCVPCFTPMVRMGDAHERAWECPECGPRAAGRMSAAA
ncbi:hypothetical protein GCM10025783_32570 [Amnibacterium soli]|jgi:hypothetical protein|uniref:Uncharacterized protein n=1 Tax=Amnibacterium soli TaxID=1282736 RepID=A0ABP8ZH40_9MICO